MRSTSQLRIALGVVLSGSWVLTQSLGRAAVFPEGPGTDDVTEERKLNGIIAGAYNSLGLLYFQQGKFGDAAEAFAHAAEAAPNTGDIYYNLGLSRLRLGQSEKAIDSLRKAVDLDPRSTKSHEALGEALFQSDRFQEAIPHLERAQRDDPGNFNLSYTLAVAYARIDQPNKSASLVADMLKGRENSPELHLALARIDRETQRLREAIEEAQVALELNPRLPLAHYEMGLAYVRLDRTDKACLEFQEEVKGNPTSHQAYYALAQCEMTVGQDFRQAVRDFQKVIALRPSHVDSYFGLAKANLKLGDLPEAERMIQTAIELSPQRGDAHYLLAQILQKAGRSAEARHEFEIASRLKSSELQKKELDLSKKISPEQFSTQ